MDNLNNKDLPGIINPEQKSKLLSRQIVDNLKGGSDQYLQFMEITEAIEVKIIDLITNARKEENEKAIEYLKNKIQHLNNMDAVFCKHRWDKNKPIFERAFYREESNKVTFARQVLEQLLKEVYSPVPPFHSNPPHRAGVSETGYCIESIGGAIQHGTYSDSPDRSKELFVQMYYDMTGDRVEWSYFEKQGDRVVKVKLIKQEPSDI